MTKYTIKDVSKRAGVSIATVSLVMNNKPGVGPETRRKVLETIEEMNFTPNRLAQGLITRKTNLINLVVSTNEFNDLINPFFIEIINQVSVHLQDSTYRIMLNVIRQKDEQSFYEEELKTPSADGYLVFGSRLDNQFFADVVRKTQIPLLIVNRQLVPEPLSSISPDNFKGGYLITRHLIDYGHSDIAFVGHSPGINALEMREQGFLHAMKEQGLTLPDEWMVDAHYNQGSGYLTFKKLWEHCRQAGKFPTAIVAANDVMALGIIESALEMGLKLPDDLSITGFDGVSNVHLINPSLTTVQIDFRAMGIKIVQKMLQMLKGVHKSEQLLVDVEVKARNSTRKLI